MTPEERIPIIEEVMMSMAFLRGRSFQVLIDSRENVVVRFPVISQDQILRARARLAELRMTHIEIKADDITNEKLPFKRKKRRKH